MQGYLMKIADGGYVIWIAIPVGNRVSIEAERSHKLIAIGKQISLP